ncbi:MerR family transcriptional regulator [Propioniferax innocua]|uniref:DNA-binding transcriptional MerR regulator n=1 Tax=Propioniferax innocua TaxID=1753 RepID=A0A542ZCJ8_9ACTN|nr:MerR family transcriptional regulator [Propioniferax innocua]TQL58064.1 DNA-binding transcriptional MerR regulator [Propioniferax innocua]
MLTTPPTGDIPEGPLRIGDVAELTGLSLRSIRHYEELGIVMPARRTSGGFREYDSEAVERLRLIMQLRVAGIGLDQVGTIVDACRAMETGGKAEGLAEAIVELDSAVAELERRLEVARSVRARLGGSPRG